MTAYFCPGCWHQSREEHTACPACGYLLSRYNTLSYDEKLTLALRHPIREHRMIAIHLLGRRKYAPAVSVFTELLKSEQDYYVIREMADAARKIASTESAGFLAALAKHPSRIVRELIREEERCTR